MNNLVGALAFWQGLWKLNKEKRPSRVQSLAKLTAMTDNSKLSDVMLKRNN